LQPTTADSKKPGAKANPPILAFNCLTVAPALAAVSIASAPQLAAAGASAAPELTAASLEVLA
jgi:hypothetical protein